MQESSDIFKMSSVITDHRGGRKQVVIVAFERE